MQKVKDYLMKNVFTSELKNRVKSLAWRIAMILIAVGLQVLAQNMHLFSLGTRDTVLLGLFFGELSKYFNKKYDIEGRIATAVLNTSNNTETTTESSTPAELENTEPIDDGTAGTAANETEKVEQ